MRKTDDKSKKYARSADRLVHVDGGWYFQTREGARGPFESKEAAKLELMRYIDTMKFIAANEAEIPSGVDWKDVTLVNIEVPMF
jgi:hypothetical protein